MPVADVDAGRRRGAAPSVRSRRIECARPDRAPSAALPTRCPACPRADLDVKPYRVIHFDDLPGVECPCGIARRALADEPRFPGTFHRTRITTEAKLHYHRRLTETYYILECEPDAAMQLDDALLPVRPGTVVLNKTGVGHPARCT